MIAYVDSSILGRPYLIDEPGHEEAARLLLDPDIEAVTGTWTRVEVSGALVRAARAGRHHSEANALQALDHDLGAAEALTVVTASQDDVERAALALVRQHGLRALDAWHLAVASLVIAPLADAGERVAFATRDGDQGAVAELLGFERV